MGDQRRPFILITPELSGSWLCRDAFSKDAEVEIRVGEGCWIQNVGRQVWFRGRRQEVSQSYSTLKQSSKNIWRKFGTRQGWRGCVGSHQYKRNDSKRYILLHICVCVCVCVCKFLSYVQLFATLWIVAWQAPLSMVFSRQEHQSGSPFPSPGDLPNPGIELGSPTLQADSLLSEPPGKPAYILHIHFILLYIIYILNIIYLSDQF